MDDYDHRYSYDRTAMGPASRFKDANQTLKQAETAIERAKAILHGLVKEMEFTVHHTHDQTIQSNFKHVKGYSDRLDGVDKQLDELMKEMAHFERTFR